MVREQVKNVLSGYLMLVILFALQAATIFWFVSSMQALSRPGIIASIVAMSLVFVLWFGFFMVHPNQARVLQLFGAYAGTAREPGLRWANPFYAKRSVSVRIRDFESSKLKVNDSRGSPIEIAAVVVWRVIDTAEAIFEVDDYKANVVELDEERKAAMVGNLLMVLCSEESARPVLNAGSLYS